LAVASLTWLHAATAQEAEVTEVTEITEAVVDTTTSEEVVETTTTVAETAEPSAVPSAAEATTTTPTPQPPALELNLTGPAPLSVDTFEEVITPTDTGDSDSAFRFSYPVRDSESGQIINPPTDAARGDVPSAITADDLATASALGPVMTTPGVLSGGTSAPFQTIGESGELPPDMDEGIFSRSPFRYSFAVYEGYNSNVNTQPSGGVQSLYTEVAAGVGYEFGGSRLQLQTSLSAALTFYYNNSQLRDDGLFPTINLIIGANYDATPRLDLSFATLTTLQSQPNFSVSGGADTYQGPYIISDTTLGAKYLWLPKFATETTYNPVIWYYIDPGADTTDFSRFEQTVGQQFLYLWKPQTALVAEYRFNTRNYFYAKNYDSIGNYALLGFDHTLNPRSTLTFRGGAEQRINQNPVGGGSNNYIGPFGQLNFVYSLNPDTVVALQSRYGTTASNIGNYNQGQQALVGVNVAHQFTRRIAANAFFNYQNNYYTQPNSNDPNFYDNVFNSGLNVSFQINRIWSLLAGYTFTGLTSTSAIEKDYNQNIVYLGTEIDL